MKAAVVTAAFCLGLAGAGAPAQATDKSGAFWGFGATSCAQFSEARQNKSDAIYRWWLAGYMTAVNNITPDTYNIVGAESLSGSMAWIEAWCADKPDKTMTDATIALTRDLYPRRQTAKPPP